MPFGEVLLTVFLGAAYTQGASLSLHQPTLGTDFTFVEVLYEGRSFQPPLYYGYRLSLFRQPSSVFGIEGEFIHLKAYARTDRVARAIGMHRNLSINELVPISDIVERFSISHGLNLVLVNAVARRTLGRSAGSQSRVQLEGRFGAGPTLPHPESLVEGVSREGYELGAVAFQAGAAVHVQLFHRMGIIAEYKFTRTSQRVTIDSGTARGTFASHHAVFGVVWRLR
jgi:hypothetical protein